MIEEKKMNEDFSQLASAYGGRGPSAGNFPRCLSSIWRMSPFGSLQSELSS